MASYVAANDVNCHFLYQLKTRLASLSALYLSLKHERLWQIGHMML